MKVIERTNHDDESAISDGESGQEEGKNAVMPEKGRWDSELGQKLGIVESQDLETEEHEKARLIAEGVQAWKLLTEKKVPNPTNATAVTAPPSAPSASPSSPSSTGETFDPVAQMKVNGHEPGKDSKSPSHDSQEHSQGPGHVSRQHSDNMSPARPRPNAGDGGTCPFASTFGSMPIGHPKTTRPGSGTQRPETLPTPPEISIKPLQSPTISKRKLSDDLSSAPPSAAGSTSKCPIRFLDHYSPEEVAEYFKKHKHEIPRSHEVCVKRYQSNAESIRQLDNKYGNLVNMIQGLGAKHQPLLPATVEDDDNSPALHGKSIAHIKDWAEGVQVGPEEALGSIMKPKSTSNSHLKQREMGRSVYNPTERDNSRESRSRLPYNLKEIRVGESPSRLWGITVPMPFRDDEYDDDKAYTQPAAEGRNSQTSLLQERGRQPREGRQHPRMVFTGPVFIGYPPEQATAILRQSGIGERGEGYRAPADG